MKKFSQEQGVVAPDTDLGRKLTSSKLSPSSTVQSPLAPPAGETL